MSGALQAAAIIDAVAAKLSLGCLQLRSILEDIQIEMDKAWTIGQGLGHPSCSLRMLKSHVNQLPTGSESGTFYTIDVGGTNVRVRSVILSPGCEPEYSVTSKWIPVAFALADATAEDLFGFIAAVVKEHLIASQVDLTAPAKCGFTFSFPMRQMGLTSGILIEWPKGFQTAGCVGNDVAEMLNAAFARAHMNMEVGAVTSGSLSALVSCAYNDLDCRIGVIVGTGVNCSYYDPIARTIISTGFGNYNSDLLPRTEVDIEIDELSTNPGRQVLEKMVSGYYLPEIVRKSACRVGLQIPTAFSAADLSKVLQLQTSGEAGQVTQYMIDQFSEAFDDDAAAILCQICNLVMDRSAALCTVGIAAAALKLGELDGLTAAVDGSVITQTPGYKERVLHWFRELVPQLADSFRLVDSTSGCGAAIVVASNYSS